MQFSLRDLLFTQMPTSTLSFLTQFLIGTLYLYVSRVVPPLNVSYGHIHVTTAFIFQFCFVFYYLLLGTLYVSIVATCVSLLYIFIRQNYF